MQINAQEVIEDLAQQLAQKTVELSMARAQIRALEAHTHEGGDTHAEQVQE